MFGIIICGVKTYRSMWAWYQQEPIEYEPIFITIIAGMTQDSLNDLSECSKLLILDISDWRLTSKSSYLNPIDQTLDLLFKNLGGKNIFLRKLIADKVWIKSDNP